MGKQLMGFQKYSFPFMLGFHSGKGFFCLRIKSKFSRRWAVLQPRAKPRCSLRGPLALALAVCEWARGGGGFLGGVQVAPGHQLLPLSLLLCCCRSQRTLQVCRPLTGVTV